MEADFATCSDFPVLYFQLASFFHGDRIGQYNHQGSYDKAMLGWKLDRFAVGFSIPSFHKQLVQVI
jgi:hypothetical protein